jgi:uroporphyrinogen-III synthase
MSKKTDSSTSLPSTNLPLKQIRILVGRARHQASALSAELRNLGAQVLEIPFIEIRRPRSYQPLDSALRNLADYDWLILTSVNGVEAMWTRMAKLKLDYADLGEGHDFSRAEKQASRGGHEFVLEPAPSERSESKGADTRTKSGAALAAGLRRLRIAAIGPATKSAIEQRGAKVEVVPKEYVAESVVRSLRRRVQGKRVLLVRAKVARDVIPKELRKAGAHVDVVEAYETVVPKSSRARLLAALNNPRQRPHVITFTSSSTVRNFVALLGGSRAAVRRLPAVHGGIARAHTSIANAIIIPGHSILTGILTASIGPVTSSTLRELGLGVNIEAREYTIPGLVDAISACVEAIH